MLKQAPGRLSVPTILGAFSRKQVQRALHVRNVFHKRDMNAQISAKNKKSRSFTNPIYNALRSTVATI